jgi:hypothetical protein
MRVVLEKKVGPSSGMASSRPRSGVLSYSKGSAQIQRPKSPTKGIVPMKTHRWMTHLGMRARAVPGKHSRSAQRTDQPGPAARRLLGTALLLGVGVGTVATSGYAIVQVSAPVVSAGNITNPPWMY